MTVQTTWVQADLAAIETAIATGAKRVRFQTHEVEYQSMSDLLKARDLIRASLDACADGGKVYFTEFDGGY
ncbi:hypothetical protein [Sinorhizobium sp. BG8]|uniref:phage head-tail joining protein n=1 Tax=Sinorhizobium sp. BG8 TaxID=2613773 RepID=UPI00193C9376|nr:hypothetical protein [Sinorhizobium sp. BG8]QRM55138.1 hypothetical protein F3Y30_11790 [Sinorhizobium sp. BG8]